MADTSHPLSPIDGTAVDGLAATFIWSGNAGPYEIEVAADDSFDDLLLQTPVDESTSLTIYSLLPRDARRLYWRVRSAGSGWSAPAWFLSSDRQAQPASGTPAGSTAAPGAGETAIAVRAVDPNASLYHRSVTSTRELGAMLAVLIGTMLIIALGIAQAF